MLFDTMDKADVEVTVCLSDDSASDGWRDVQRLKEKGIDPNNLAKQRLNSDVESLKRG